MRRARGDATLTATADPRLWAEALVALLRSGTLTPTPPAALRTATMLYRHGASVATPFAVAAARHPQRTAVIDDTGSITYGELYARAATAAGALRRDLGSGSVAILCRNHRGFAVGFAAAALFGTEVILVNTEQSGEQLESLLRRHAPDVLIHDAEYSEALERIGPGCRLIRADALLSGPVDTEPLPPSRHPVGLTLLTSGTTGLAKGVPRSVSRRAVVDLACTGLARMGVTGRDTVWLGPPLFHGYGILAFLGAVTTGATVVCRPKFDAAAAIEDIRRHRATVLFAVPIMVQRILDLPDIDDAARELPLRRCVTGAAPITADTVRRFQRVFGPVLINGYGSTEAGIVTVATQDELARHPDTLGRPALGVAVRILDDDGAPLPPGARGRIAVRGALGYSGYTPDPSAPAHPEAKRVYDGFIDTGDVGRLDSQGLLYLSGRSDDMIVSGGENVFPGEVENVLATHPLLTDAVVIGVPDDEYGQVLHAYVVAAGPVTEADLRAHVSAAVERYKTPKRFHFIDAVPRTPSGKVLKARLGSLEPADPPAGHSH